MHDTFTQLKILHLESKGTEISWSTGRAASMAIASIENMAFQAGLRLKNCNIKLSQSFIAIENWSY